MNVFTLIQTIRITVLSSEFRVLVEMHFPTEAPHWFLTYIYWSSMAARCSPVQSYTYRFQIATSKGSPFDSSSTEVTIDLNEILYPLYKRPFVEQLTG